MTPPSLPDEIVALIVAFAWVVEPNPRLRAALIRSSRQLHRVAVSLPSLWSTIWEQTPSELVSLYVQRARPRSIHLRFDWCSGDPPNSASDKVKSVGDRLSKLSICGPPSDIARFFKSSKLPSVDCVEIRHGHDKHGHCVFEYLPKQGFEASQRMRSLTIGCGLILHRRAMLPRFLSYLRIHEAPKLNALLHALSATPGLEHLSLGHTKFLDPIPLRPVSLSHLQRLDVVLDVGGSGAAFFQSISFPSTTKLSVGIFVTPEGMSHLDEDIQAATQYLRASATPLLGIGAIAHGRHFERGTLVIQCFENIRTDANGTVCGPICSIDLWWNDPWPIPNREYAYGRILHTLPLDHVRELALCWKGPPFMYNGEPMRRHLGLAYIPKEIPHVSTVLLSDPMDCVVDATLDLPLLERIVTSAHEWNKLDCDNVRRLLEMRRESGYPDVTIKFIDDVESFGGNVTQCIADSSYIRDEIE